MVSYLNSMLVIGLLAASGVLASEMNNGIYVNGQEVKVGIITDVHYRETPRVYIPNGTYTLEGLQDVDSYLGLWGADLRVQLGDFVDGCNQSGNCSNTSLAVCDLVKERIAEALPYWSGDGYYNVIGNHEIGPQGCTSEVIADLLGMPGPYYSFDYGRFHFIVLNDPADNKTKLTHSIGVTQMGWLKEDLLETSYPAIIFSHVPLSSDFSMSNEEVSDESAFRRAISGTSVIAVISGHAHTQESLYLEGHEDVENDVRYYYIPSFTRNKSGEERSFAMLTLSPGEFNMTVVTMKGNDSIITQYNFTIMLNGRPFPASKSPYNALI